MRVTTTSKLAKRPRFQLAGEHGSGKSALAATLETPGMKDILFFSSGDGGMESISHRDLPCVEMRTVEDYEESIKWLRSATLVKGEDGLVKLDNMFLRGVIYDLFSEGVSLKFTDLIKNSDRVKTNGASPDKGSQNEYGEINQTVVRWVTTLRALPIKYVGFTCGIKTIMDEKGNEVPPGTIPRYIGREIWKTVAGSLYYGFLVKVPGQQTEAKTTRKIRTQPSTFEWAKSRIPGVAGKLPLPEIIDFKLGHPTLLRDIFKRAEDYSRGLVKLEPVGPEPAGIEAGADVETTPTVSE